MDLIANHLWQSTIFAAAAGFLTLALKNNRAHVRYRLWFAACVKFLLPFSVLVAVGSRLASLLAPSVTQPEVALVLDTLAQPFVLGEFGFAVASPAENTTTALSFSTVLFVVWGVGCVLVLFTWWLRWRRVALIARGASPIADGHELKTLRRLEQRSGLKKLHPIALLEQYS